jgi:hypothetical protein
MNREKITVQLDAVRKYRNKSEYRTIPRVRCNDLEVIGDGKIIRRILRQAHDEGASLDALVEVYRGETLCFRLAPLKAWIVPGQNPIQKQASQSG